MKENFKIEKYILALVLILLFHTSIYGQLISGTVTFHDFDDLKQPAPGVMVMIKDTNRGIVTDIDGKYQIAIDSIHNTLQFNYMGYEVQEIKVGKDTIINIILEKKPIELSTFELTAYYQPKRTEFYIEEYEIRHHIFFRKRLRRVGIKKVADAKIIKIEKKWERESIKHNISDWINYIYENINYPDTTIYEGICGKVYVMFAIDGEGCLKDLEIRRGLDNRTNQNISSTFKSMPELKPDTQYGPKKNKHYPTVYILPLRFRIIACENGTCDEAIK